MRAFLLCTAMAGVWGYAPGRAVAAEITPASATSAEQAIQAFMTTMLGPDARVGARPIRMEPAGDHYTATATLAPGTDITAIVRPGADGLWNFEQLRAQMPAHFTVTFPGIPAGAPDTHMTYDMKAAEQDGHGTIDTTLATASTITTTIRGLDTTSTGKDTSGTSHVGRGSGTTLIRPAADGRLDVLATSDLEDFTSNTTVPLPPSAPPAPRRNAPGRPNPAPAPAPAEPRTADIRFSAGKAKVTMELDSLSRDQAPALMRAAVTVISTEAARSAAERGGVPMSGDVGRAMVAALDGLASGGTMTQSFETLHVLANGFAVEMDKLRIGLAAHSPAGVLDGSFDVGLDGLAIPALARTPYAALVPSRFTMRPVFAGLKTADVLKVLSAAADDSRPKNAGPPPEMFQLLQSGTATAGIEALEIDLGATKLTANGKVGMPGPGQVAGVAQIVATQFDALVDRIKTLPQANQALPVLLFAKGIGRNVGETLVWDITYDGRTALVNGVDVMAMGGRR